MGSSELDYERAALIKADQDIARGAARLRIQQEAVARLEAAGHDSSQAKRLMQTMEAALEQWERHRTLIIARIAYLEASAGNTRSLG